MLVCNSGSLSLLMVAHTSGAVVVQLVAGSTLNRFHIVVGSELLLQKPVCKVERLIDVSAEAKEMQRYQLCTLLTGGA